MSEPVYNPDVPNYAFRKDGTPWQPGDGMRGDGWSGPIPKTLTEQRLDRLEEDLTVLRKTLEVILANQAAFSDYLEEKLP